MKRRSDYTIVLVDEYYELDYIDDYPYVEQLAFFTTYEINIDLTNKWEKKRKYQLRRSHEGANRNFDDSRDFQQHKVRARRSAAKQACKMAIRDQMPEYAEVYVAPYKPRRYRTMSNRNYWKWVATPRRFKRYGKDNLLPKNREEKRNLPQYQQDALMRGGWG